MSKSKSRRKGGNPFPRASRTDATRSGLPKLPWVRGGRDYGPAHAALADLVAWAFELAEHDVADWPEGQLRVRSARKYVVARLSGNEPRSMPFEDVLFTASLLARIFDDDLDLGLSEVVTILDELGLPTDIVPFLPRKPGGSGGCAGCNPICSLFRNAA